VLRDKNLVPLSHQHQHALALCVRLDRALQAGEVDLIAWQAELQQIFDHEIGFHFAAEEAELFPAAARLPDLQFLTEELISEHAALREYFARASACELDRQALQNLATALSAHIRKEERRLFEGVQRALSKDELAALGARLQAALASASKACLIPSEATRLKPRK